MNPGCHKSIIYYDAIKPQFPFAPPNGKLKTQIGSENISNGNWRSCYLGTAT